MPLRNTRSPREGFRTRPNGNPRKMVNPAIAPSRAMLHELIPQPLENANVALPNPESVGVGMPGSQARSRPTGPSVSAGCRQAIKQRSATVARVPGGEDMSARLIARRLVS